ncbi:unnamed protein product [Caenorhabditis brenneri]
MSTSQSHYCFVKNLGEGTFGKVILLENSRNANIKIAMKQMISQDKITKKLIKSEYQVLQALTTIGHINVIKMFGMKTDNVTFCMYLEYVDGGELLKKILDGMSLEKATYYFRQLVEGLAFLHENNVVHRDIKPENLLLTKSDVIKISDFGFSTFYRNEKGEETMLIQNCGTRLYAAPELFKNDPFRGPPVDVWSAGVVLMEMIIGVPPWESATESSFSYLQWILTDDVEARATIEQIKNDSWLVPNTPPAVSLLRRKMIDKNNSEAQQTEYCTTEKRRRLEVLEMSD